MEYIIKFVVKKSQIDRTSSEFPYPRLKGLGVLYVA